MNKFATSSKVRAYPYIKMYVRKFLKTGSIEELRRELKSVQNIVQEVI